MTNRAFLLLLACVALIFGCPRKDDSSTKSSPSSSASATTSAPANALTLEVVFSSEKKDWADAAIKDFNAQAQTTSDGRPIVVHPTYGGSVEPIDGIVAGTNKPHVFSPASSLVLPLLNDAWTGAKGASAKPIVGQSDSLVLSPVVIATWKPMAEALGWPAKKIGWKDVADLAKSKDGWVGKGHPEWGDFRFGHTHPGYSNSGLIAVLAENYAAVGKTRDLEATDVDAQKTKDFVRAIEGAVVHYGRSTGFFYDSLASHGPAYLSAAVLYENVVVTSAMKDSGKLAFPLVALYPKEGTQWADHPYAVLDAPWVGAPEKEAAKKLHDYLLSKPIQQKAMEQFGFRPALTDIALGAPIDASHGADPKEPQTLLATPSLRTLRAVLDQWKDTKRAVEIELILDRSGSMQGERIAAARDGLATFLNMLRPNDRVVFMTFNTELDPPSPPAPPAEIVPKVQAVFADGGTALYDAIVAGRDIAEQAVKKDPTRIHAVVCMTDGEDRDSKTSLDDLMSKLVPAEKGGDIRVFTIGYGDEANAEVLGKIAKQTGGAYYHGDPTNIKSVYEEIASFF
jgi:Ca-activated chloride channel family protein